MHKASKWAKQIIELQDSEGKWGWFHSLSQFYDSPITTEQALRRLKYLGYTIEDECIRKAVSYMNACLIGEKEIPDRREKLHNWDLFASMILATWIREFTMDNPMANQVAGKWAKIITHAFSQGYYNHDNYVAAYEKIMGMSPRGGRFVDFVSFYQVSLVRGCLDTKTEEAMFDYLLNKEDGMYYIYDRRIKDLPPDFESKQASRYLAAIEILADFEQAKPKLQFVADWLNDNKNENGKWDMGKTVNDKLYFPYSDDWRKREVREADCTERITKILEKLEVNS